MERSINDRLNEWLLYRKISQAELARKLIIKGRSQVNQWCRSTAPIPDNYILDIIRLFPDLSARWFITGSGDMLEKIIDHGLHIINESAPPYKNTGSCTNPDCMADKQKMKELIYDLLDDKRRLKLQIEKFEEKGEIDHGKRVEGGVEKPGKTA